MPLVLYPTPPYLLLREIMGPRPKILLVRLWLDRDTELQASQKFRTMESVQESYALNKIEHVTIQDSKNKGLQYDATSRKLFAKPLEGGNVNNRAIFEILSYLPMVPPTKMANTLKIHNTNLYLSCSPNGELIAQENAKLDETKKVEMDEFTKQFFFFREQKGNYATFESVMYPGKYISTMDVDDMPVTVTNDNQRIREFLVVKVVLQMTTRQGMSDTTSGMFYPYDRFCLQVRLNRNHVAPVYLYLVHSPYLYF